MSEETKEYVRFQRANYIVSDLKKSLKLYCDVLGFINQYESDAPDDSRVIWSIRLVLINKTKYITVQF